MTTPDSTKPTAQRPPAKLGEFSEVLIAFGVMLLLILLTAHVFPSVAQEYLYSIILAGMVWVPVMRIERRGFSLKDYNLTLTGWKKDILFALMWMALTYPLFVLGHHAWQTVLFGKYFSLHFPAENLGYIFIEQALFIALPEEVFYRAWMLPVFLKRWPAKLHLFNAPFGKAVFITSVFFALGHLASIPAAFRLGVFFPSLLFSWMALKRGSILSPILYHATSNVLMAVLSISYYR